MEQVIAAHLSSPPPQPSAINPRVPAGFDDVIARGMAKDPDDRYGSPGALGRAAQRALGVTPSGPSTGPSAVTQAAPVRPAAPASGNSGPTLAAWQVAQQHPPAPQQPSTSPARPWLMPAVITAAAALILGGIGVVIGLLARQNSTPPTSAPPTSGYTVPTPTPSYQPEEPPTPPTQVSPKLEPSVEGPPGTDAQGWISYPARVATRPLSRQPSPAQCNQYWLSAKSNPEPSTTAVFGSAMARASNSPMRCALPWAST